MKFRKFVDTVAIRVAAGDGGNGSASFRREANVPRGGPDGGDGGRGGDVILKASRNEDSLLSLYFAPERRAENAVHGRGQRMHGRNGADTIVLVPCGTQVRDAETKEWLGDLVTDGEELIVARGGRGGLGNCHWVSSTHQTPTEYTEGVPGELRSLRLDLKLIADAGFVGLPNAGKSSLLRALTHAHPKIAAYPFTTLNPIIGTLQLDEEEGYRLADIPGLIEGAHRGAGLGDDFLRHVERAAFLVFVLDMAGTEGRNPVDDYRTLKRELKLYNPDLGKRACMVVANKMDLPEGAGNLREFRRRTRVKTMPVSAVTGLGIDDFRAALVDRMRELCPARRPSFAGPVAREPLPPADPK